MLRMRIIAIILIVIGATLIIHRSILYTQKKTILKTDSIKITKEEPKSTTWPYYAGGAAILTGIIFILFDTRRRRSGDFNRNTLT
jgi:hypothetical protein